MPLVIHLLGSLFFLYVLWLSRVSAAAVAASPNLSDGIHYSHRNWPRDIEERKYSFYTLNSRAIEVMEHFGILKFEGSGCTINTRRCFCDPSGPGSRWIVCEKIWVPERLGGSCPGQGREYPSIHSEKLDDKFITVDGFELPTRVNQRSPYHFTYGQIGLPRNGQLLALEGQECFVIWNRDIVCYLQNPVADCRFVRTHPVPDEATLDIDDIDHGYVVNDIFTLKVARQLEDDQAVQDLDFSAEHLMKRSTGYSETELSQNDDVVDNTPDPVCLLHHDIPSITNSDDDDEYSDTVPESAGFVKDEGSQKLPKRDDQYDWRDDGRKFFCPNDIGEILANAPEGRNGCNIPIEWCQTGQDIGPAGIACHVPLGFYCTTVDSYEVLPGWKWKDLDCIWRQCTADFSKGEQCTWPLGYVCGKEAVEGKAKPNWPHLQAGDCGTPPPY